MAAGAEVKIKLTLSRHGFELPTFSFNSFFWGLVDRRASYLLSTNVYYVPNVTIYNKVDRPLSGD